MATTNDSAPNVFGVLNRTSDSLKAKNKENIAGFEISLIKKIADKLNLELEINVLDFEGVLAPLNQEKIDVAITCMSITEERSKKLDHSKAYIQAQTSMIVRRNYKRFEGLIQKEEINFEGLCDELKKIATPNEPIQFVTFQNTAAIPVIEKIVAQTNIQESQTLVKKTTN
ncbi:transporter substrate-binding domain-containing protein [Candidatus Phytoplasma citri]